MSRSEILAVNRQPCFRQGKLVKPCINAKSLFLNRINESYEHPMKNPSRSTIRNLACQNNQPYSHIEKYWPLRFEIMTRISWDVVNGPHNGLGTMGVSYIEKYFSHKNSSFRREIFSSFRNFPPLARIILDTSKCICYVVSNLFCMIFPGKIIITKINLPLSRIRQIKIEKLRLGPKIWRSKLARPCIRITL